MPHLVQVLKDYGNKGFDILAISADSDEGKYKSFIKEQKMDFINIYDAKQKESLVKKYGVRGFPTLYLVDPNGKVVAEGMPLRQEGGLEKAIDQVLKDTPPTKLGTRAATKAGKELEKADGYYAKKDYSKALKAYEKIVKTYKGSEAAGAAAEKVKAMKADKAISAAIAKSDADKKARPMLDMAADFVKAGKVDAARDYYKKVIDQFPDSEYAKKAKVEMDKLSSG